MDRFRLPKKSLGQHFLKDTNICLKIIEALELEKEDLVFEIGPGRGALTFFIEEKQLKDFIVLEKDFSLALDLREKSPCLKIICIDALNFSWQKLKVFKQVKLVGNLPYNVASPLIWNIISEFNSYSKAVFMVQKEVAKRIVASPGSKEYGMLSVWLQFFSEPKILFSVSPKVFFPVPKVYSAVLSFSPLPVKVSKQEKKALQRCLKVLFQQRRKQLQRILRNYLGYKVEKDLEELDLNPQARPEELSKKDFFRLALKFFSKKGNF